MTKKYCEGTEHPTDGESFPSESNQTIGVYDGFHDKADTSKYRNKGPTYMLGVAGGSAL